VSFMLKVVTLLKREREHLLLVLVSLSSLSLLNESNPFSFGKLGRKNDLIFVLHMLVG
jgi:hypothetical protein